MFLKFILSENKKKGIWNFRKKPLFKSVQRISEKTVRNSALLVYYVRLQIAGSAATYAVGLSQWGRCVRCGNAYDWGQNRLCVVRHYVLLYVHPVCGTFDSSTHNLFYSQSISLLQRAQRIHCDKQSKQIYRIFHWFAVLWNFQGLLRIVSHINGVISQTAKKIYFKNLYLKSIP